MALLTISLIITASQICQNTRPLTAPLPPKVKRDFKIEISEKQIEACALRGFAGTGRARLQSSISFANQWKKCVLGKYLIILVRCLNAGRHNSIEPSLIKIVQGKGKYVLVHSSGFHFVNMARGSGPALGHAP
jgi:hypothetical protein